MIPDLALGRRLADLFPVERQAQAADVERTIEDRVNYPSQRFTIACTATTRPTNPRAGDRIYETDTNRDLVWDGNSWEIIGDVGSVRAWAPGWVQPGAIAGVANYASCYKIFNNVVFAWVAAQCGVNQGIAGNLFAMDIPVLPTYNFFGGAVVGNATLYDWNTGARYSADLELGTFYGTTRLAFVGDWSSGAGWGQVPNLAFETNDIVRAHFTYPLI